MKTLIALIAAPSLGECGLKVLKALLAWALLIASMAFPVAGWHRLFLKIPGWHWWPMAGYLGLFGIFTGFLFHQQVWLLMAFPLSALFANDCLLILYKIWSKKPPRHVWQLRDVEEWINNYNNKHSK